MGLLQKRRGFGSLITLLMFINLLESGIGKDAIPLLLFTKLKNWNPNRLSTKIALEHIIG